MQHLHARLSRLTIAHIRFRTNRYLFCRNRDNGLFVHRKMSVVTIYFNSILLFRLPHLPLYRNIVRLSRTQELVRVYSKCPTHHFVFRKCEPPIPIQCKIEFRKLYPCLFANKCLRYSIFFQICFNLQTNLQTLSPPFRFVRSYAYHTPAVSKCQYKFSIFSKYFYLQNRNIVI